MSQFLKSNGPKKQYEKLFQYIINKDCDDLTILFFSWCEKLISYDFF